jgi:hypothetical protein
VVVVEEIWARVAGARYAIVGQRYGEERTILVVEELPAPRSRA